MGTKAHPHARRCLLSPVPCRACVVMCLITYHLCRVVRLNTVNRKKKTNHFGGWARKPIPCSSLSPLSLCHVVRRCVVCCRASCHIFPVVRLIINNVNRKKIEPFWGWAQKPIPLLIFISPQPCSLFCVMRVLVLSCSGWEVVGWCWLDLDFGFRFVLNVHVCVTWTLNK